MVSEMIDFLPDPFLNFFESGNLSIIPSHDLISSAAGKKVYLYKD